MSIFYIFPLFFIFFTYLIDASESQKIIEQEKGPCLKFNVKYNKETIQKEYPLYKEYFGKGSFFSAIYAKENNLPLKQKWDIEGDIIKLNYSNNIIGLIINDQTIEESMLDLFFNLLNINDLDLYNMVEKESIDTLSKIQLLGKVLSVNEHFQKKIELHIKYKEKESENFSYFELINNEYNNKIFCKQQRCLKEGCYEKELYGILLIYQDALKNNKLNNSSCTVDFSFLQEANNFNNCKWLCNFEKYETIYNYLSHLELFPKKTTVTDVILDLFRLETYDPYSSFLLSLRKKFNNLKRVYVSSDYIGIVRCYEKLHFFYYSYFSTNYDYKYSGRFNPLTIYVADTQQAEQVLKNAYLFYYKYSASLSNLYIFTSILSLLSMTQTILLDLPVIDNYYTNLFSFLFLISSINIIQWTSDTGIIDEPTYSKLLKKNNNIESMNWRKIYSIKPALVYTLPIICYLLYLTVRKINLNIPLKELLLNKKHCGALLLFLLGKYYILNFRDERLLYMIAKHTIFKPREEYKNITA